MPNSRRMRRRDHPSYRPMSEEYRIAVIVSMLVAIVLVVGFSYIYMNAHDHRNDPKCDVGHALYFADDGHYCVPVYAVPPTT